MTGVSLAEVMANSYAAIHAHDPSTSIVPNHRYRTISCRAGLGIAEHAHYGR